jgi:putative protease
VGEFLIEAGNIKEGDELMVIGPSIGMAKELIHSLIVNGEKAEVANKGDKITFPFSTRLTSQDKLYKILKS